MSATSVYFRAVFWLAIMTGYGACSDSEGRIGDVEEGEGFSMTVPKGEKNSCVRARWITMLLLAVLSVDILVGLIGLLLFYFYCSFYFFGGKCRMSFFHEVT